MIIDDKTLSYKNFLYDSAIKLNDSPEYRNFINAGHSFLIENIRNGRPIYGVTTGYGEAGQNYAAFEDAEELQYNLFSFHGCGVGEYLSEDVSRIMLIIRMASLAKGKSGISYDLLKRFELLLEKKIYPLIPSQGSVGASGDLTPLSYIAAVIAGEREVMYQGKTLPTCEVYETLGITPYIFKPKEALAIMNGTAPTTKMFL